MTRLPAKAIVIFWESNFLFLSGILSQILSFSNIIGNLSFDLFQKNFDFLILFKYIMIFQVIVIWLLV